MKKIRRRDEFYKKSDPPPSLCYEQVHESMHIWREDSYLEMTTHNAEWTTAWLLDLKRLQSIEVQHTHDGGGVDMAEHRRLRRRMTMRFNNSKSNRLRSA